jgi:hypothetical protein
MVNYRSRLVKRGVLTATKLDTVNGANADSCAAADLWNGRLTLYMYVTDAL